VARFVWFHLTRGWVPSPVSVPASGDRGLGEAPGRKSFRGSDSKMDLVVVFLVICAIAWLKK